MLEDLSGDLPLSMDVDLSRVLLDPTRKSADDLDLGEYVFPLLEVLWFPSILRC